MEKKEYSLIKNVKNDNSMSYILFVSFVGALAYFVQQSEGFGGFLLAILKAIVWPALVMHRMLEMLSL